MPLMTADVAFSTAKDQALADLLLLRLRDVSLNRVTPPGDVFKDRDMEMLAVLASNWLSQASLQVWDRKSLLGVLTNNMGDVYPSNLPFSSDDLAFKVSSHVAEHGERVAPVALMVSAVLSGLTNTSDNVPPSELLEKIDFSEHLDIAGQVLTQVAGYSSGVTVSDLAQYLPLGIIEHRYRFTPEEDSTKELLAAWGLAAAALDAKGWTLVHSKDASNYSLKRILAASAVH